jgi:hypothetical protein
MSVYVWLFSYYVLSSLRESLLRDLCWLLLIVLLPLAG